MENLADKKCRACELGEGKLGPVEIEAFMTRTPKWSVKDNHEISRRFKFKNFAEALVFVNKVGSLAESEGHHPDIKFGWGYVEITLFTHAVSGLSENDFILATKIDQTKEKKQPKLGPIVIGVNNIEKAKDFYLKVFEIKIDKQSEHYLSAYLEDRHLELEEDSENRFPNWKQNNIGTYKNCEFIVHDMNLFLQKVKENGGKVVNNPVQRPWGGMNAEIADPDGNILLISQQS